MTTADLIFELLAYSGSGRDLMQKAAAELEALQADKARLDWLESESEAKTNLGALYPSFKGGFKTHLIRQAIDAAMRQSAQSYDWVCDNCGTRISDPEQIGEPYTCPHCGNTLRQSAQERKAQRMTKEQWIDREHASHTTLC